MEDRDELIAGEIRKAWREREARIGTHDLNRHPVPDLCTGPNETMTVSWGAIWPG